MLQVDWFVGSILSVRRTVLACIVHTDGFIMAFTYITNFDHIRYPLPSLAIFLLPAVLFYFRVLYFIFMFCDPTDLIWASGTSWGVGLLTKVGPAFRCYITRESEKPSIPSSSSGQSRVS